MANELLKLINACSSISEYRANSDMPKGIVMDYLNINKNYILLCNGKKMKESDSLKKGDSLLVFYNMNA